jgi:hypothetical protein
MALERDSRQEEELKLLLRTQINYEVGRFRIKKKYELVKPMLEALRAGKGVLGIPDGSAFEVKYVELPADQASPDPNHPAAEDGDATK